MYKEENHQPVSSLLRVLGHPVRIRILEEIGFGEACVCHLETKLGIRQAYLSQQLMALREAGILHTYREGRFIYYSITDRKILDLVHIAAEIKNTPSQSNDENPVLCVCPKCEEA